MEHQFTLPSSGMTCFSNVSAQAQQLVNGLNNITLNSSDNTITFNNTTIPIDKSLIMDLINNLIANVKGIIFGNINDEKGYLEGINNGYVFDDNDELVLDYNPNMALSTVFGYQIKNQADVINSNLETEIYTRQQSDKTIMDQLIISNKNCETVQAMLAYMVFDRTNKQMIIFIPVPKQDPPVGVNVVGHMDNLPGENLIDESNGGSAKPPNPKEGIVETPIVEYENKIVGMFDADGFTADTVIADSILNKELITQAIYFTNEKLETHSILKGIDLDMNAVNINNQEYALRVPCSAIIKDNLNTLYYRNFLNSCYFDLMQTSKGENQARIFKYLDPWNPNVSSDVKLSLDSSGWEIWKAIKANKSSLDNFNKDSHLSNIEACFKYDDWRKSVSCGWGQAWRTFFCDEAIQMMQPSNKYADRYPTVTIYGDLEIIGGNIYFSKMKNDKQHPDHYLKRKNCLHDKPENSYGYTWIIGDITGLQDALNNKLSSNYATNINNNTNEIATLKTTISTMDETITTLSTNIDTLTGNIKTLTDENTALKTSISTLTNTTTALQTSINNLTDENTALKDELSKAEHLITQNNDNMIKQIRDLQVQIDALKPPPT